MATTKPQARDRQASWTEDKSPGLVPDRSGGDEERTGVNLLVWEPRSQERGCAHCQTGAPWDPQRQCFDSSFEDSTFRSFCKKCLQNGTKNKTDLVFGLIVCMLCFCSFQVFCSWFWIQCLTCVFEYPLGLSKCNKLRGGALWWFASEQLLFGTCQIKDYRRHFNFTATETNGNRPAKSDPDKVGQTLKKWGLIF